MNTYAEYKDSGAEWLGIVPASWPMVLLSQLVTLVKKKNIRLEEKNLLSLSYGHIKRKPIDTNAGLLPESFDGYNIIEANDIVLRLTDLQNDHTSLRVGLSNEHGIITSAYVTMRPKETEGAKYLYYLLHTFDIRKGFYGMGSGVRQGLNYNEVKRLVLPMPSLPEQTAIAAYLDRKVTHIDTLIAEAKASIEEYKAWKASIIYEAVTKGLDRSVEMKETGVEWIGCIPKHWHKAKIKQIADSYNGDRSSNYPSGDDIKSEGILFVTSNNLGSIMLNTTTAPTKYITKQKYHEMRGAKLQKDDIVFCLRGSVGKCSINKHFREGTIASSLVVFRATKANADFLNYLLQNKVITEMALTAAIGIGSLNLSAENITGFTIAIPPIDEQIAIANYLNDKCCAIDSLISEKESLVSDLEAYKKSLIFEVVTGKRKVI